MFLDTAVAVAVAFVLKTSSCSFHSCFLDTAVAVVFEGRLVE